MVARHPLALAAAALALAGCGAGGPSDEEQVRTTLRTMATATAEKDYERLCDEVFARELLEGIEKIGLPCATAMRNSLGDVENPRLTVGKVLVNGDKATAEVRTSAQGEEPSSDVIALVRADGGWRVSSLSGGGQAQPDAG